MAGIIKVNTDQVGAIATNIEKLNNDLKETLLASNKTIKDLEGTWQGEAYQATFAAYDEFSKKYFENYHEGIQKYVKFLREHVDQGYFQTETTNINYADQFK